MTSKERRLVRKWKKEHPLDHRNRKEVLSLLRENGVTQVTGITRKKKFLEISPQVDYNMVIKHPTITSLILYLQDMRDGDYDALNSFKKEVKNDEPLRWTSIEVMEFMEWYMKRINGNNPGGKGPMGNKNTKEEVIMSKKDKEETKKGKKEEVEEKKSGKGSGLVPKEKVQVPKELYKHPKIGKLLKKMDSTDDPDERKECRIVLRSEGFKLSDESTWKKFLKEAKSGKVDDDDEEEDEKPKKKAKKEEKKPEKKVKKAKDEEEEEDDEEEDDEKEEDDGDDEEETTKSKKSTKK